jgi:hypothetical protein
MNVRTPARRSRSIFWDRFARVGVQGYSHATSRGVAQYEFGKGRERMWSWFPGGGKGMVGKEAGLVPSARAAACEEREASVEQDMVV